MAALARGSPLDTVPLVHREPAVTSLPVGPRVTHNARTIHSSYHAAWIADDTQMLSPFFPFRLSFVVVIGSFGRMLA